MLNENLSCIICPITSDWRFCPIQDHKTKDRPSNEENQGEMENNENNEKS